MPTDHCVDEDDDGYGDGPGCTSTDCDDTNADIHPGAEELCGNNIDDNCNGEVDEGFDRLGKGCSVGDGVCRESGRYECTEDGTQVRCDAEAGEPDEEICDGLDNDCNGQVDDHGECQCETGEQQECYPGAEGTRGIGICSDGVQTCGDDGVWGECEEATVPALNEVCNGKDDDCNGLVDDVDLDDDGYFDCPGVAERDCDDENDEVHPGASETCNSIDDNCNGLTDETVDKTFYLDNDGDGYGDSSKSDTGCDAPPNYVKRIGDCNDQNPDIHPGASETCNDLDDDCNGKIDDGLPEETLYRDVDNDGFGPDGARTRQKCLYDQDNDGTGETPPVGWALETGDCDDTDATINPDALDTCDGKDNDCDGYIDRWCGETCKGSWPVNLPGNRSAQTVVADMNQDGQPEIASADNGLAIINPRGKIVWQETSESARRSGTMADLDNRRVNGSYTLEWVVATGSDMGFVRPTQSGFEHVESGIRMYDNSKHGARDIDHNGTVEVIGPKWSADMEILEYDENQENLVRRGSVASPDNGRIYFNGMAITDVDGDGTSDFVWGTGHSQNDNPSRWTGNLYAFGIKSDDTIYNTCSNCYDTDLSSYYKVDIPNLFVSDSDGDGTPNLHTQTLYAKTNQDNTQNAWYGHRWWNFQADNGQRVQQSPASSMCIEYDDDGDGNPECHGYEWRHDIDGDGDQDRVTIDNGRVVVERWENGSFAAMAPGEPVSGRVQYLGDLNGDGQLDALFRQGGAIGCQTFGRDTHHPWTSRQEPVRRMSNERTHQKDNWEPNDQRTRAYDVKDDKRLYHGYISDSGDVDWFEIARSNGWCADATVRAPNSYGLELTLYGGVDRDNDGNYDELDSASISAGQRGSVSCSAAANSNGLDDYWLEIESSGNNSSTWDPYRASFRINY